MEQKIFKNKKQFEKYLRKQRSIKEQNSNPSAFKARMALEISKRRFGFYNYMNSSLSDKQVRASLLFEGNPYAKKFYKVRRSLNMG